MKTWLYWVTVNGLFMAFFVFGHLLPSFAFSGLYFIVWMFTSFAIVTFAIGIVLITVNEDLEKQLKDKIVKRSKWYYRIDMLYDLIMVFILAGLGFYVYAGFYVLANALLILLRGMIWDE